MAIINIDFFSKCFNRNVPLMVCLPADNYENENHAKTPYKTLYLLHGLTNNQNDWINKSNISSLSQEYNIAVVMPIGENSFYLDDAVRGAFYGMHIGQEIVNFTRTIFDLSDKREDTIIGGLSMGGYGAARNGLKYADTFGAIFAFSSAFIIDKVATIKPGDVNDVLTYDFCAHVFGEPSKVLGSDVDPKFLAKDLIEKNANLPRFYLACGSEDYLIEFNRDYVNYLKDIGFPHVYKESPGVHDWVFWNEYIKKALDWYFSE